MVKKIFIGDSLAEAVLLMIATVIDKHQRSILGDLAEYIQ